MIPDGGQVLPTIHQPTMAHGLGALTLGGLILISLAKKRQRRKR